MKRRQIAILILSMFLVLALLATVAQGEHEGAAVSYAAEETPLETDVDSPREESEPGLPSPSLPAAEEGQGGEDASDENPDEAAQQSEPIEAPGETDSTPDITEPSADPAEIPEAAELPEALPEIEEDEAYNPTYAKFAGGTAVYADRDCTVELGRLDSGEVLCLSVVKAYGNGGIYRVLFDTERTADAGECEVGFVRASTPKWLDQDEVTEVLGALSSIRKVSGLKIPMISFTYAASAQEEVPDMEEAPVPEAPPEMEEAPVPEEIPEMEDAPVSEEIPEMEEVLAEQSEPILREAVATTEALLYAEPDTAAKVLAIVSAGDGLSVLEEGASWTRVLFQGLVGYVESRAVEMEFVVDVPLLTAPAISAVAETEELQIDGVVYVGETITLKADLDGYEFSALLQWQCNTNPVKDVWENVPGATGPDLSVVVSEENADWLWRLVLSIAE